MAGELQASDLEVLRDVIRVARLNALEIRRTGMPLTAEAADKRVAALSRLLAGYEGASQGSANATLPSSSSCSDPLPEGWVAVPREPTAAMVAAALSGPALDRPLLRVASAYRAMIAAASSPTQE